MKTYQGLIPGALLLAAFLLAGCDNSSSGPPKADTSQQIQASNNPNERPMQQQRPAGR